MDNDHYGHVNNVAYYSFFDTAVNGFLIEASGTDIRDLPAIGIVAESSCRFLSAVSFPDTIHAGLAIERLGTSSIVYRLRCSGMRTRSRARWAVSSTSMWTGARAGRCPFPDVIRQPWSSGSNRSRILQPRSAIMSGLIRVRTRSPPSSQSPWSAVTHRPQHAAQRPRRPAAQAAPKPQPRRQRSPGSCRARRTASPTAGQLDQRDADAARAHGRRAAAR